MPETNQPSQTRSSSSRYARDCVLSRTRWHHAAISILQSLSQQMAPRCGSLDHLCSMEKPITDGWKSTQCPVLKCNELIDLHVFEARRIFEFREGLYARRNRSNDTSTSRREKSDVSLCGKCRRNAALADSHRGRQCACQH